MNKSRLLRAAKYLPIVVVVVTAIIHTVTTKSFADIKSVLKVAFWIYAILMLLSQMPSRENPKPEFSLIIFAMMFLFIVAGTVTIYSLGSGLIDASLWVKDLALAKYPTEILVGIFALAIGFSLFRFRLK